MLNNPDGGGGSTTVNSVPVALRNEQYYEETGTLPERLFMILVGLAVSPILAYVFHVLAFFVVTWVWTLFVMGFVVFCIFHVFDFLVWLVGWFSGRVNGGTQPSPRPNQ